MWTRTVPRKLKHTITVLSQPKNNRQSNIKWSLYRTIFTEHNIFCYFVFVTRFCYAFFRLPLNSLCSLVWPPTNPASAFPLIALPTCPIVPRSNLKYIKTTQFLPNLNPYYTMLVRLSSSFSNTANEQHSF